MPVPRKLYTVEEARDLIPVLRPRLQEIAELWREIRPYRRELRHLEERANQGGGTFDHADEYLPTLLQLKGHLDFLRKAGVEVKDMATGLVDFPSLRDGRVVYLCWNMREETISHWHEMDAGFAGRRPLED